MYPPLTDPQAQAFLATIAEAPHDLAARLVFADWLEERDDPRAPWMRIPELWLYMARDARDPPPSLLAGFAAHTAPALRRAPPLLRRVGPPMVPALREWVRQEPRRG